MRKKQRQVIIEVSPSRHELAVFENDVLIGRRAARPSRETEAGDWTQALLALEAELPAWVQELGAGGCPATVIYTGPDTVASVHDCPASAGEHRAKLAARLAMADTISFPLAQNAHAETCLFRDRNAPEGEQPKLRTLAIADTEATILGLALAIERSGLKPNRFVPAPGASLAAAIETLVSGAVEGSPHVVLWVGEHASVITAGDGKRVAFARLIPVGTETLVEALARPAAAADTGSALLVDRCAAREMLFASGIPTVDGWRDSTTSLDAKAVLPLIQPVLQRLAVELKQSIRFGLSPESRGRAVLAVCGPGSHIAGLGESVSGSAALGMADHAPAQRSASATLHGDIATVLALGARAPVLTPREVAAGRSLTTARRAAWVGAALGLLAIGADAVESWDHLRETRRTLGSLALDGSYGGSTAQQAMQAALAARMGVNRAEAREREQFGAESPHGDVLRAISALTPEAIKLTEITFAENNSKARCELRGLVSGDAEGSDSERFRGYASALGACPLIADTKLGETRRATEGDYQTLSFALTLDLVELPTGVRTAAVDDGEGATP